ncbi:hypothetical protein [Fusibacter sp. JL216-2]|uniref:hypothetical protein n=1 Tax=Fusibacter sp. JL216-2 TaxID=3071453 RepID=UPI003D357634
MRKPLIMIMMVIVLLTGCDTLRGDSRSYRMDKETKYLAELCEPIDLSHTDDITAMFERQIRSQNIVLSGEVPGVSGNADLQKYFFEAFNGMREIDYLVVELPFSAGEILNGYMKETGEDKLDEVFDALKGKPYATEENRSFFRQLKLMLKSRGQTVRIVGVDLEYAPELSLNHLTSLIGKHASDAFPLASELIEAKEKGFIQADYLQVSFLSLLKDFRNDPDLAMETFGNDYGDILNILVNLELVYEEMDSDKPDLFNHVRSDRMVANFLRVYDNAPNAMYYGQLSNPAVMQSSHLDYDWFASAIQNERDSIKNKVVSLLYTYEDCKRMIQLAGRPEVEKLDLFKFDNKTVLKAINRPYTLISLIEKDSLFNEASIIFEKDFEGAVTDYFQYLIVLKDSPAAKALE